MLRPASDLIGYGIDATDGEIGSVSDLLFDDSAWTVRWAVVDTGGWLPGRRVLAPPSALGRPDDAGRRIPAALTRAQVEDSPGIESDAPVSRQNEARLYRHYQMTPYWGAAYAPPVPGVAPVVPPEAIDAAPAPPDDAPAGDPHLRSANEVTGYYIQATDESVGHVEDFLLEDSSWTIRYLIVDTRNWWPGRKVLVAPQWLRDISWADQEARLALTRAQVKGSPEYDPEARLSRDYESTLYGYYNYPPYWP